MLYNSNEKKNSEDDTSTLGFYMLALTVNFVVALERWALESN
jgi:hypothetical protein